MVVVCVCVCVCACVGYLKSLIIGMVSVMYWQVYNMFIINRNKLFTHIQLFSVLM